MNVPEFRVSNSRHVGYSPIPAVSLVEEAIEFVKGMETSHDERLTVITTSPEAIYSLKLGVYRCTVYGEPALFFWRPQVGMARAKGNIVMLQDPQTIGEVAADFRIHSNPVLFEQLQNLVRQMKHEEMHHPDEPSDHNPTLVRLPDGSYHAACHHVVAHMQKLENLAAALVEYLNYQTYQGIPMSKDEFAERIKQLNML